MSNISNTWTYTLLSEIALIQMGQSPNSRSYNNKGEGLPFFQGKADFGKLFPTVRKWCTEPERIAEEGDILLSVRAPVGPTNLAAERCCIGRGLATIQAIPPLNQKYLLHHFRHIEPWLSQQGTGTTFAGIGSKIIQNLEIPVAPLNEQKRIADKLDILLARVDACRDRLERVSQIIERFRQSVIAAATSGELTEDWSTSTDLSDLQSFSLSEILSEIKTGPFGSALHRSDYVNGEIPVINPMHINDGKITHSFEMAVSPEKARELSDYRLRAGDVVIARRGVMGRCAVVQPEQEGWLCGTGSMILRVQSQILPDYLQLFLSSPATVKVLETVAVGSTMVNLNQRILLSLQLLLPTLPEQQEIVRRAKNLFAYADRIEVRYQNTCEQVEQLTSVLLSTAFCGKLVPQDPNDEAATVLLERIRAKQAEQAAQPKKVSKRKPTMTKMTEASVKQVIHQWPKDIFSFDELRDKLSGDDDLLIDILFVLLSEAEPCIMQIFDQEAKTMRFVKGKK